MASGTPPAKISVSLFAEYTHLLPSKSRKQLVDCRKSADVIIRSSQIRFRHFPPIPRNNKSPFCGNLFSYHVYCVFLVVRPSSSPLYIRRIQWPSSTVRRLRTRKYCSAVFVHIVKACLWISGDIITARYRNNTLLAPATCTKIIKNFPKNSTI